MEHEDIRPPYILAAVLILIGLFLVAGGGWLVSLGGTPYYLAAGLAVLGSGILAYFANGWAPWLYGVMLIGTLIWSISEVGLDLWALVPRLLPLTLLGTWFMMPWVGRSLHGGPDYHRHAPPPSGGATRIMACLALAALGLAVFGGDKLWALQNRKPIAPPPAEGETPHGDWRNYGNTLEGSRYSQLAQITVTNVSRLQLAWQFRTGDLPRFGEAPPRQFAADATPIKVGNTLYTCTPHNIVIALDAVSGKERWRFDPHPAIQNTYVLACRGVSYYEAPNATSACARRIVGVTLDSRLFAIDADTGRSCSDFGAKGFVSLLEGVGRLPGGFHYLPSPPTIVKDHIVVGGWLSREAADVPSGVIRSYDAMTGKLLWAWDMGVPDRTGAPPQGQSYTRNTPNAWAPFAADAELNLVYVPTGNSAPYSWGGKRRPFDEKYSSSVVALDLDTGRPKWSFQTTHHDLWDYDLAAQPVLADLPTVNGYVPALVQATKRGEIFVLNRRTGEPIVPVTEKPVPRGAVAGDRVSPTQPFSGISWQPAKLTEIDMWGLTPLDQLVCRIEFRRARYDGIFTPPDTGPTIAYPGALGVIDWGGIAVDGASALVVANTSTVPYYSRLVRGARQDVPFTAETEPFKGPLGVPCTRPPWGFLQMYDLKTRKLIWRHPIGTAADIGPFGIPSMLPFALGVSSIGSSVVTRGQLIFNGGTLDRYLRAYDLITGDELWKVRLPAGGQATPMTYMGSDGRQYVVISAGGDLEAGTATGDYIMAYALPKGGA